MREPVIHKKTGNTYYVVGYALNATNDQDGDQMVMYENQDGKLFVREINEMREKFEGRI